MKTERIKNREIVVDEFDKLVKLALDLDLSGMVNKRWSDEPQDIELCETVDKYLGHLKYVQSYLHANKDALNQYRCSEYCKIFGMPFKEIHSRFTEVGQKLQILQSTDEGGIKALFMNDCYTMDTDTEATYHGGLVSIGMQRKRALDYKEQSFNDLEVTIIGGGDGGTLRECLTYPVKKANLLELDSEVIEVCREYLPTFSAGAFDDERFNPMYGDAFERICELEDASQDIVFVDLNDVEAPAEDSTVIGSRGQHLLMEIKRVLKEKGVCSAYCGSYPRKYYRMFKKCFQQTSISVPDLVVEEELDKWVSRKVAHEWFFASGVRY
jgi:spermidine synthase